MKNFNIVLLCRSHHQEQHRIGILSFFFKYPRYVEELEQKGWYLIDAPGGEKLWNDKLKEKK
jgi:hypothetical protein